MVADVGWRGEAVYLVRLLTNVNDSGPILSQLGYLLGFRLAECILIHDDIDLPLGNVRTRMRGGDGGHKGVRSILQAFQTDVIRRVKIGVGRPTQKEQLACYVLTAFSSAERPIIDRACVEAADHTPEMVMSWRTRIG
jgi:peptidyl-tRNA hydrolase